jgi:hypothetical protein
MLAEPEPPLPSVTRIAHIPVFATDGTLGTAPGYQASTQVYFAPAPGLAVPDIPVKPTRRELSRARRLIQEELLGDFPFGEKVDLAHAVALLLLPFARNLISGPTPLHVIDKPMPGTGASLLAQVITLPALGESAPTMTEGSAEDEWRKRIFSKLLEGPTAILLDNIRRPLQSAALASALTSTLFEDRLLGLSKIAKVPVHATWIATGNNVVVSDEIARRTIQIRLDARMERPWERADFRHSDLRSWALSRRSDLVWAACILIRSWLADGRPPGTETLGMFENWAATMGGIVRHAGIQGFLANQRTFYAQAASESELWRWFIARWWTSFGQRVVSVGDLYAIVRDERIDLALSGRDDHAQRTSLGMRLQQQRDRHYGQHRITWVAERHGAQHWRLIKVRS